MAITSVTDIGELPESFSGAVATIGNFDGVHMGHRDLLRRVREDASKRNSASLVITFDPHPSEVLYPARSFTRLTTKARKESLIEECGIDGVLHIPFTLDFASKGPMGFLRDVLIPLKLSKLYVGHDFNFGSGRSGNVDTLKDEGEKFGFEVEEVPEVMLEGDYVRSSIIRELIHEGHLGKASRLLGRRHAVSGTVIKGHGRGVQLGFPTANLGQTEEAPPGPGIYISRAFVKGEWHPAATHVGVIPTFDVDVPGIEAHLLDYSGELLGEPMDVQFIKKIRETVRFDSPKALEEQIRIDCDNARKWFAEKGPEG